MFEGQTRSLRRAFTTKRSTHDDNGKFLLVLFDKLIFHLDSREKMPTTFLRYRAPAGLFPVRV